MSLNLPVKFEGQIINPPALLSAGVSVKPGSTTTVTAFDFDGSENILYCQGTSVPSSEAGYAKGCQFTLTNAANGSQCVYVNIGDATTCNFQLLDVANVQPVAYQQDAAAAKSTNNRIYTGTVTGTLQVGETVTQATSSATAVIVSINTTNKSIDVNTVTGTWDATHVATGGTSGATFTPTMTLLEIWTPTKVPVTPIVGGSGATAYTQVPMTTLITTTKFRYEKTSNKVETLKSDSVSTLNLEYGA